MEGGHPGPTSKKHFSAINKRLQTLIQSFEQAEDNEDGDGDEEAVLETVSHRKLGKAVLLVLFNQTVVGFPVTWCLYQVMLWRGCEVLPQGLPSFWRLLGEIGVFAVFEEIGFYYLHRLFHHPFLYKRVHKLHHEWTAPIGLVSIYAHPLEHALVNLLPAIFGPVALGSHLACLWVWMALVLLTTTVHHSGYHFPLLPSPEYHDFHHLKFNACFGVSGILDWLHGTDALFRKSKASLRHRTLLSLKPMSQLVLD
ncbi:fatty acid hydroxylase domain-containing protein 2-like [Babylonia areolata]|uniref:fatty acid hydroxylase domain-containing protein 2-like n=1 Tax=Babylonia areolata TaxID=304850 RepID=UPI003FD0B7A2